MKYRFALFIRNSFQFVHYHAEQRGWDALSAWSFDHVIHVQDCYVDRYDLRS